MFYCHLTEKTWISRQICRGTQTHMMHMIRWAHCMYLKICVYIYIYHLCLVFVRRMKIAIHFWQSNAWSFDTNLPASCRGRQVYNPGEAYHIGCWSKLVRRCLKSFNNAQGKRENLMDIQKCIYVFFSLLFSLRNIKDVSSQKHVKKYLEFSW